jgi:hypothetical protein
MTSRATFLFLLMPPPILVENRAPVLLCEPEDFQLGLGLVRQLAPDNNGGGDFDAPLSLLSAGIRPRARGESRVAEQVMN